MAAKVETFRIDGSDGRTWKLYSIDHIKPGPVAIATEHSGSGFTEIVSGENRKQITARYAEFDNSTFKITRVFFSREHDDYIAEVDFSQSMTVPSPSATGGNDGGS